MDGQVQALIDQDGVLAAFDEKLFELCVANGWEFNIESVKYQSKRYLVDHLPKQHRGRARRLLEIEGWFRELPVIEGAQEGIEEMFRAGWDVHVCTKPLDSNLFCASEKMAWIQEHFPSLVGRVMIVPEKNMVKGDFLLDDAPKVRWLGHSIWEPVIFDQPYNREGSKWGDLRRWRWGQSLESLWPGPECGIEGILERKRNGIDCTEDESVEILNYFTDNEEYLSNPSNADHDQVVMLFPLEWDQWFRDKETNSVTV